MCLLLISRECVPLGSIVAMLQCVACMPPCVSSRVCPWHGALLSSLCRQRLRQQQQQKLQQQLEDMERQRAEEARRAAAEEQAMQQQRQAAAQAEAQRLREQERLAAGVLVCRVCCHA